MRPDLVAYNALIAAGMNGNKPDEVSRISFISIGAPMYVCSST